MLKLDLSNKQTDQHFFDQFIFARAYSTLIEKNTEKQFAYFSDYYKNITNFEKTGYANIIVNNIKFNVYFDELLERVNGFLSNKTMGIESYPSIPVAHEDGLLGFHPEAKSIFPDGQINIYFQYKDNALSLPTFNHPTIFLHYNDKNKANLLLEFLNINYNKL